MGYFGHVPKPVSWLGMEKVQLVCNCIQRKGSVGAEKRVQTFGWQNILLDNKYLGNSSVRISHPNSLLPKRLAILRRTSPNSNSSNHCKVNSKLLLPCKRDLSGWKKQKNVFSDRPLSWTALGSLQHSLDPNVCGGCFPAGNGHRKGRGKWEGRDLYLEKNEKLTTMQEKQTLALCTISFICILIHL